MQNGCEAASTEMGDSTSVKAEVSEEGASGDHQHTDLGPPGLLAASASASSSSSAPAPDQLALEPYLRDAIGNLPASVQRNIAACVAECDGPYAGALKRDLTKAAATPRRLPDCRLRKLAQYTLALPVAGSDDIQTLVQYYQGLQEVHREIRAVLKRARSEDNASVHAISLWSTPPRKVATEVTWLELVVDADCGISKGILLDHFLKIKKITGIVNGQPVHAATSTKQQVSDEPDNLEKDSIDPRSASAAKSTVTSSRPLNEAGQPSVSRIVPQRETPLASMTKTAQCNDADCKGRSKGGCSNGMCGVHCTGRKVHKQSSKSADEPPRKITTGKASGAIAKAAKVVNGQLHRPVVVDSDDGLTRAERLELRKKRVAMLATISKGKGQSSSTPQADSTKSSVIRRKVVMEDDEDDGVDRKPKRVKMEE